METMQTGNISGQTNVHKVQMNFNEFRQLAQRLISDNEKKYALICMTISNINFINSVFGATVDNEVLEYVMNTIIRNISSAAAVSRFSTESFIIITDYSEKNDIIHMLDSVSKDVKACKSAEEYEFSIDILSSIYVFDEYNNNMEVNNIADNLFVSLRHSDITTGYFFYDSSVHEKMSKELEIVRSVDDAIKNNEFHIYLQPQHYLQHEDRVLSAEALVRWIKKDGKMVYPGDFIPILEKNGLISKLDCHVMELTCQFIAEHIDQEWFDSIVISVNVSKVDLKLRDFIEYYTNVRNKYKIPDGRIEIEFTESAVFEDYTIFKQIMLELRKSGFYCSIDDFGTGSSSLNMLKSMPVDVLKMDRMFFVCDNENDIDRNNSVIASVVAMARGLGMKIVAEGIESPEKIDFLRKIGCDIIQGYVYSKPLSISEFETYVKNYIPKYLPASEKMHPSPLKGYNVLDAEAVYEKYAQVMPYVSAVVIELDIESDMYSIVSFGQDNVLFFETSGQYSDFFENVIINNIQENYQIEVNEKISLKGIISAFYRGDHEIKLELMMKKYDNIQGKMIDEYIWWLFHVCFQKVSKDSKPMAIIFISNIQEKKEREISAISAENRLKAAIKSIKCEIYNIDLKNYTAFLVHGMGMESGTKKSFDLKAYIEKKVYREDKQRLLNIIDSGEHIDFIKTHSDEDYYTEYRIINSKGKLKWKSIHFVFTADNEKDNAIIIIQDITEHKLREEEILKSQQILYQFFSTMCVCVFEVKLETDYFHLIKAEKEYETYFNINTESSSYKAQFTKMIQNSAIHKNDSEVFINTFSPENLQKILETNDSASSVYRAMTSKGYRWYEARTIKNSESNMVFVYDIDDRKMSELRENRELKCNNITGVYSQDDFYDVVVEYTEREGLSGEHIMIMAQIDDFDNIKEQKGIEYCDILLCNYVKCMQKSIRKDDVLRKCENGMFMLFLKNTGRANVEKLISKIRNGFECEKEDGIEYGSFCAGISTINKNDKDIQTLCEEAREALITARKLGAGSNYTYSDTNE